MDGLPVAEAFAAGGAGEFGDCVSGVEWKKREEVIGRMIQQVGWLAGEFSQLPKYSRENIEQIVVIDGFENFDAAKRLGKGVLFLTGHMSAWELSSFAHALYGYPLHFLVRPVANRRVDSLINGYRCLSGNRPIDKNKSARAILKVLGEGGDGRNFDGPQHVAGRRYFREFLRSAGVDQFGFGATGVADGCGGGAGIFDLGYGAAEIPAAIREGGGIGAYE